MYETKVRMIESVLWRYVWEVIPREISSLPEHPGPAIPKHRRKYTDNGSIYAYVHAKQYEPYPLLSYQQCKLSESEDVIRFTSYCLSIINDGSLRLLTMNEKLVSQGLVDLRYNCQSCVGQCE